MPGVERRRPALHSLRLHAARNVLRTHLLRMSERLRPVTDKSGTGDLSTKPLPYVYVLAGTTAAHVLQPHFSRVAALLRAWPVDRLPTRWALVERAARACYISCGAHVLSSALPTLAGLSRASSPVTHLLPPSRFAPASSSMCLMSCPHSSPLPHHPPPGHHNRSSAAGCGSTRPSSAPRLPRLQVESPFSVPLLGLSHRRRPLPLPPGCHVCTL